MIELSHTLMDLVPRAMWIIRSEMRLAASSEFTIPQFRAMAHLHQGLTTNRELAELQGVGVSTMSRIVESLVRRGLVDRFSSTQDRRQVELILTKAGEKELRTLRKQAKKAFDRGIGACSPEDQRKLQEGLRVLGQVVDRVSQVGRIGRGVVGRMVCRLAIFLLPMLGLGFMGRDLVVVAIPVPPSSPMTLEDCYRAALKQSEVVADRSELVEQAQEKYTQALGAMRPTLTANAIFLNQSAAPVGSTTPAYQPLVRLSATQPLFSGFRDFAALRQTQKMTLAQTEAKRQATTQVYLDMVQNFYMILALEKDRANLEKEMNLYEKRIQELKDRVRIGRSRETEVLTTKASLATLRAQLRQLEGQLGAAREAFAFLTGMSPHTTLTREKKEKEKQKTKALATVDFYLNHLSERPDLRSWEHQKAAADESIAIAKAEHWPSADVGANYYLVRTGASQNVNWDLTATVTFPLFSGGLVQSRVREATSQSRSADLNLHRVQRQAETEVRSLHQTVLSELEQLRTLRDAQSLSERNYQEETKEYRLGLVTNLEVVQALTAFQETLRAVDRAYFSLQIDQAKLEVAAGLWAP